MVNRSKFHVVFSYSTLIRLNKGTKPLIITPRMMKVFDRVMERRIRCQVAMDNMQFGFMPGKGTTDAIFIMRQVQEKYQARKNKLYYVFCGSREGI